MPLARPPGTLAPMGDLLPAIGRLPRRGYVPSPTRLHPLPRLGEHLGLRSLWIKRDDELGLAAGGNKTRKLDFYVADAIASQADTLITTGAVQSNHCRLTCAAAAQEGLACRLLLEERVPNSYDRYAPGNNLLFQLLGVEEIRVVPGGVDVTAELELLAEKVRTDGGRPYVIPGGGSHPLGAVGYVIGSAELYTQAQEQGLDVRHVILASGSGGTHAGYLVGSSVVGASWHVQGISVRRESPEQEALVSDLAQSTARFVEATSPPLAAVIDDEQVGPGYSRATPATIEAVLETARLEGILLDPVYTGKVMAALFHYARSGRIDPDETIVFLHTGGSPSLHAYARQLIDWRQP